MIKVHGNCFLLVNRGVVGSGRSEEVAEGGSEWLVVIAGDVDGCGECVRQGVVDEDQETEEPDLGPLGHAARKRQEGGRPGGAQRGSPREMAM